MLERMSDSSCKRKADVTVSEESKTKKSRRTSSNNRGSKGKGKATSSKTLSPWPEYFESVRFSTLIAISKLTYERDAWVAFPGTLSAD